MRRLLFARPEKESVGGCNVSPEFSLPYLLTSSRVFPLSTPYQTVCSRQEGQKRGGGLAGAAAEGQVQG